MRDFSMFDGPMYTWPKVEALPGVNDTLAALHPHWLLAVATNAAASDEAAIRAALARVELDAFIDRVYCFQNIGHQKPSPAFFEYILNDLGLPPEQVMMVGDHIVADVMGASGCGIRAVWLNQRTDDIRTEDLIRTIHRFDELPALLESWGSHQK